MEREVKGLRIVLGFECDNAVVNMSRIKIGCDENISYIGMVQEKYIDI